MSSSSSNGFGKNYGSVEYWNERYENDPQPFEWYQNYQTLANILHHALYGGHTHTQGRGHGQGNKTDGNTSTVHVHAFPPKDICRILILGCGSSRMGEDMMKDGWGWTGTVYDTEAKPPHSNSKDNKCNTSNIHVHAGGKPKPYVSGGIINVDFSPVVIAQRRDRMKQIHDTFYRCIAQRKTRWLNGLPLTQSSSSSSVSGSAKASQVPVPLPVRGRGPPLRNIPEAREDEQVDRKSPITTATTATGNSKSNKNENPNHLSVPVAAATKPSPTKTPTKRTSTTSTDTKTHANANASARMTPIPKMVFECIDVTKRDSSRGGQTLPYPDDSFDLILNKGTLDAILCSNGAIANSVAMMEECARVLNPNHGKMIVISYGSPENRRVYFENHKVGRDRNESMCGSRNVDVGRLKDDGDDEGGQDEDGGEDEHQGEGEEQVQEEKEWWRGLHVLKVPKPKIGNAEFQNGGNPNKCHYVYIASK